MSTAPETSSSATPSSRSNEAEAIDHAELAEETDHHLSFVDDAEGVRTSPPPVQAHTR